MPNPYLEWMDEKGELRRLEIVDRVLIGRSCKGIDRTKRIIVIGPLISRDHAMISLRGSHLQITDMSKNGTWINNVRLAAGASQELSDGDIIRLGERLICVKCPDLVALDEDGQWAMERTRSEPTEIIVTHLVADMRGFSGMSQRENSSQVYALMSKIFDILSTIVRDCKGTIKDYTGDAVYAFWDHGLLPGKDQAVLACQAALKQGEAIDQMRSLKSSNNNSSGECLMMGWGITTGKVTMAHYGSRVADLALVGDSTNLAFRLSGMANKDLSSEIVICSQTADLVRDRLPVVDLGFVRVRGRSGHEHIFGIK